MIDNFVRVLTFVCALGCGLVAGIFFAFSTFVMKALARLLPEQAIAAMQAINAAVLNRWFFAPFFGTAAGCLLLIVFSLLRWQSAGAVYQLVGCVLYLVGTILVTILFNVPRNDALAAVEAGSADGAAQWAQYVPGWTAWNHIRAAAALAAAAALTVALCLTENPVTGATPNTLTEEGSSMKTNLEVRHIAVSINRPANEVYEFASNPENLPRWATGLGGSIKREKGEWVADAPMGRVRIRFAEKNQFGILDHDVILDSGVTFHNPMRVLPNGRRSEVIFTLFRQPDVTDEKFSEDAKWVEKDLKILRDLLENDKP